MRSDASQATTFFHLSGNASPALHWFTLRFTNPALERIFQRRYTAGIMGMTRFGLVFTFLLYVTFGVLDLWAMPDRLPAIWTTRGSMALVLLAVLAASWSRFFIRHQQLLMLSVVLLTSANIALLFGLMSGGEEYQHFIGMFLIIVGAYTVLGLQFHYTMLVGLANVVFYLLVDVTMKDYDWHASFINLLFLFSAMVITAAGARSADRHRRLAYYGRLQVEQEREESRHRALHDALTGLPNRRLFMEKLAQAVARDRRYHTLAGVLFIDLDDFKPLNDLRGHPFGDQVLQEVGRQLLACVRATDTVARYGGDEFVVLLEDLQRVEDIDVLLDRIRKRFARPLMVDGIAVMLGLSVGIAVHPRDGEDPQALVEHADRGMYEVKHARMAPDSA